MSSLRQTVLVDATDLAVGTVLTDGEFRRIETILALRKTDAGVYFTTDASEMANAGEYFYPKGRRVAVRPSR